MTKTITPNLWFDGNAEEAVDFYVSVITDSKIIATSFYPKTQEESLVEFQANLAGQVLTVDFELNGNRFLAINADSTFQFNEAVSFAVACENQ